jgi:hypothetical protein
MKIEDGFHSKAERDRLRRTGICQRLSHFQRLATPPLFAEWLVSLARSVRQ